MKDRRHFLKGTLLGAVGALLLPKLVPFDSKKKINPNSGEGFPMVVSTWNHGLAANEAAMQRLKNGGKAIDAWKKMKMYKMSFIIWKWEKN